MKTKTFLASLLFAPLALGGAAADSPTPETVKRAASRWGKHLVPVEVWLQRSEGEQPGQGSGAWRSLPRALRRNVRSDSAYSEKRPLEVVGLAVDARTIWLPDPGIERRFVARVAVGSPAAPAVLSGTYLEAPLWVLKPETPLGDVDPIAFVREEDPGKLLAVGSTFASGGWAVTVSPIGGEYQRLGDALWLEAERGVLLVTGKLEAVGFNASGRLGLENSPHVWRGAEIAAGPVLEFAAFDAAKPALQKKLAPWALTVRGFFRAEVEAEAERGFRRFSSFRSMRGEASANEFIASGLAVGPKLVLVHHGLSRPEALRLERVLVAVGGEDRPARFVGALRQFRAFLVEIEGEDLASPLDRAGDHRFQVSEPLIALTADHSTGSRRELVELNRVTAIERGYRHVLEPVLQHFPRPGAVFIGAEDHEFKGAAVEVTREGEREAEEMAGYSRSYSYEGIDLRLMAGAEIRALLAEGDKAFDRRLVPRSAEREKDMVWLGVVFQPLTRELAKSQGVEVQTRGGEIGVTLLQVHEGSPAAKAGFAPGDIILSLREEDEPEPWEVSQGGRFGREDPMEFEAPEEIPEELRAEYFSRRGPPWRSARTLLDQKSTQIGEGKKVEVAYLREGKEAQCWVTLELAPPDFENASRYKDEDSGLTVKDLTFEVRSHYRLKPDAPGVVVAKVERGGKAAIAKVFPFEVLVSVNGKPVGSVEEFHQAVDAARGKEGQESVLEFRMEKLGQSRIVRIR
jgi:hypothetical protein